MPHDVANVLRHEPDDVVATTLLWEAEPRAVLLYVMREEVAVHPLCPWVALFLVWMLGVCLCGGVLDARARGRARVEEEERDAIKV